MQSAGNASMRHTADGSIHTVLRSRTGAGFSWGREGGRTAGRCGRVCEWASPLRCDVWPVAHSHRVTVLAV
eukprot:325803-Chlamydomonas_euryale.AAC.11